MEWPPRYAEELDRRLKLEHKLTADSTLLAGALLQYAEPGRLHQRLRLDLRTEEREHRRARDAARRVVSRQREFIAWLHDRFTTKTSAPVEKSRDSGATWMSAAFAVWVWLFHPGSTVGFGCARRSSSTRRRPADIFEKIRSSSATCRTT